MRELYERCQRDVRRNLGFARIKRELTVELSRNAVLKRAKKDTLADIVVDQECAKWVLTYGSHTEEWSETLISCKIG